MPQSAQRNGNGVAERALGSALNGGMRVSPETFAVKDPRSSVTSSRYTYFSAVLDIALRLLSLQL